MKKFGFKFWYSSGMFLIILVFLRIIFLHQALYLNFGVIHMNKAFATPLFDGTAHLNIAEKTLSKVYNNEFEYRSGFLLGWIYSELGDLDRAVEVWDDSSVPVEFFFIWGKFYNSAAGNSSALADDWFKFATLVASSNNADWYYKGLAYIEQSKWVLAEKAFLKSIENGEYIKSESLYYLGWLYQWHLRPINLDTSLKFYVEAIEVDNFQSDFNKAQTYYRKLEILRWLGNDPDEYISELEQVIMISPKYVEPRALLGMVKYEKYQDLEAAEHEIYQAISINPSYIWSYLYLGEIYIQEGMATESAQMYQAVLELDPSNSVAMEQLDWLGIEYKHSPEN